MPLRIEILDDTGSVTAELAVVLPSVMAILGLALGALGLQIDRLRLVEQATQDARAASRGEQLHLAAAEVFDSGDLVCVRLARQTPFGFSLGDTECARKEGS